MSQVALDWVKAVGTLILSWPLVGLGITLLFRKPLLGVLERLIASDQAKAEIGPVKIELGNLAREGKMVVERFNRLSLVMAESRLLELEIAAMNFGRIFSEEQRTRMRKHIDELRHLTSGTVEENGSPPGKGRHLTDARRYEQVSKDCRDEV